MNNAVFQIVKSVVKKVFNDRITLVGLEEGLVEIESTEMDKPVAIMNLSIMHLPSPEKDFDIAERIEESELTLSQMCDIPLYINQISPQLLGFFLVPVNTM